MASRATVLAGRGSAALPVYRIPTDFLAFPPVTEAEPSGLLGVGGDLAPDRLLLAYRSGIFPWFSEGEPILWWSPDPRFVIAPYQLHIPRSLAKRTRRGDYRLSIDTAFDAVIAACAASPRPGQPGTWITAEMQAAYSALHRMGHAHSVEAWEGERLVGGLYGVAVGAFFAGESMFALADDASKMAWVQLVAQLRRWGFHFVDCQLYTHHLARFGAVEISREAYMERLAIAVDAPAWPGPWRFDDDLQPGV